jgi:undecaprenyl diphosphate synthase
MNEESLAAHLCMAGTPDPDLMIRTGGEARVSNFMLWQLAYTEFYFTDTLWPDFNQHELEQALKSYGNTGSPVRHLGPEVHGVPVCDRRTAVGITPPRWRQAGSERRHGRRSP